MIELLGTSLAVLGSILSVHGALTNNLKHDHHDAMTIWMYSNVLLLVLCIGNLMGLWNGNLSIVIGGIGGEESAIPAKASSAAKAAIKASTIVVVIFSTFIENNKKP